MSIDQSEWTDITAQILKLPKSFKLLEVVKHQTFNLQDGMHAHEINDNKIDPKYDISSQDTLSYMLSQKQIKLPSQLSIQQILAAYIEVFKQQSLILKNYPLAQTIYTFTYLYDKNLILDNHNQFIALLIDSVNSFGSYVYELHKQSASIKQDDLNINIFSFSTQIKPIENLIKEFTNVESQLQKIIKEKKENIQVETQLLTILRLRKAIHTIIKSMGKYFDNKSLAKIEKDIQSLYSAIEQAQKLSSQNNKFGQTEDILKDKGIFSNRIYKSLRAHFGPREIPRISFQQALDIFKLAPKQFQLFFPVPTRISALKDRLERLIDMPLNLWSKSYIKNNIFHKEEHIFNTLKTEDLILNDMNEYLPLKDNWKTEEKFSNMIRLTAPVVSQVLFRYLSLDTRAFWQVSKVYDDFNVLIHISSEFDASIFPQGKKQIYMGSWYYHFGLNVMVKQLLTGIQFNLYQHYQYPYVFYLLENFLAVYDRNSQIFLKKFDKTYQTSFFQDSLNKNKKKKIPEVSRKYFSDAIFKKALHYYIRSLHRIFFVMLNRKLLEDSFQEHLQIRIKNRFRIFKNIYFVRKIEYEQYKNDFETIAKDQTGYLGEAMQLLKQAKNLFQKLQTLQDSDCDYKVKQNASALTKICVKCSLAVMTLKMNNKTKTLKIQNNHKKYPQISVI